LGANADRVSAYSGSDRLIACLLVLLAAAKLPGQKPDGDNNDDAA
jgi:hypothetical protein